MKRAIASCLVLIGAVAGCEPNSSGSGLLKPAAPSQTPSAEEYTILLQSVEGPTHVAAARRIQAFARDQAELGETSVVHKADHSEVFLGRYPTQQAARADLLKAKAVRVGEAMPFKQAMVVPVPGGDTTTDKLDLRNAKGAYSVLVAVFYDVPDKGYTGHQRRAREFAQALRDKGAEAYYLLEPTRSSVTIGTFPASTVEIHKQTVINPRSGDRFYQDVPVITDARVEQVINEWGVGYRKADGTIGKGALLICGNVEWTNQINPKTGQLQRIVQRCQLVRIPNSSMEPASAIPGPGLP